MLRALALVLAAGLAVPATSGAGIVQSRRDRMTTERHEARRSELRDALARARATTEGAATPLPRALDRKALPLEPGDLVTSVGSSSSAMRIVLRPRSARTRKGALPDPFVSRGIDHDPVSGRIAIAAVSRVLIYDPENGETIVLEVDGDGEAFGFVNDVLFDQDGLLVIADQGVVPSGKDPADGRIWEYDLETGTLGRLAGRRKLSNPALLALDSRGRVLVVDQEAGPRLGPLLDIRWDTVLLLKGARRKGARPVYKDAGLQATAFDVGPDDRMWFGALSELVVIDGKSLSMPCPVLDLPFEYANGLVMIDEATALVSDGADAVTGRRFIHEVDDACEATERVRGKRIDGLRGLALVAAPVEGSAP